MDQALLQAIPLYNRAVYTSVKVFFIRVYWCINTGFEERIKIIMAEDKTMINNSKVSCLLTRYDIASCSPLQALVQLRHAVTLLTDLPKE